MEPQSVMILRQTLCAAVRRLSVLPFQGISFEDLADQDEPSAIEAADCKDLGRVVQNQALDDSKFADDLSKGCSGPSRGPSYDTPPTSCGVPLTEEEQTSEAELAPEEEDSISLAGESDEEDPEVWLDPETDIDTTPTSLNPVYRVLEEAGLVLWFVSPQSMDMIVAAYRRPQRGAAATLPP